MEDFDLGLFLVLDCSHVVLCRCVVTCIHPSRFQVGSSLLFRQFLTGPAEMEHGNSFAFIQAKRKLFLVNSRVLEMG